MLMICIMYMKIFCSQMVVSSVFAVVFATMMYAMRKMKRDNPIDALTEAYPLIHTVICNGKKSETLYQRHFAHLSLKQIYLPSTSNANRTIKEEALFACWIDTLRSVLEQSNDTKRKGNRGK